MTPCRFRHADLATDRGEGGYVLVATLVAVGMFALILAALLNAVTTDAKSNVAYERSGRSRRAVDAALEVGIGRIKVAPSSTLRASDPCAGLGGAFTQVVEARSVNVTCSPDVVTAPPVASASPGGPVLTLLANANGTLDDSVHNAMSGILGPLVSDWATGMNNFLANGPGLIHLGSEPLTVVGDAKLRQGGFGVTQPATYPAIDVVGSYTQGDSGPFGSLDLGIFGHTPPCGLLSEKLGEAELGMRVRSRNGPTCANGRDATVAAAGPSVAAPATWSAAALAAPAAMPTCPAGATVVQFSPGAYNALQTTAMNVWFQQGNCDGVTFWFKPGDYFFDASGWFGDDRAALVLNDPTSNWVFGEPKGWSPPGAAPAAAFPEACDRDRQGVSITLSSRTAIKHRGGRVAICGRKQGSDELPAIFQQVGSADQTWAGEPQTAAPAPAQAGTVPFTSVAAATKTITPVPTDYPALGRPYDVSEGTTEAQRASATGVGACTFWCAVGITLGSFGDPTEPAPTGTLSRALLKVRGTAVNVKPPNPNPLAQDTTKVLVQIGFNDGSGRGCSLTWPDVPRSMTTPYVVDLLATDFKYENSCVGVLTDATQLENSIINVFEVLLPTESCFLIWCSPLPASVQLDYVWLETTTRLVTPPSPIATIVDPDHGSTFNVFGPVHAPRSQVEVQWRGTAPRWPVFVGGIVARGLLSGPGPTGGHVGILVSRSLAPPQRQVVLRAVLDGRLRATATVLIDDLDASATHQEPGRNLEVLDWTYCNRPAANATCA